MCALQGPPCARLCMGCVGEGGCARLLGPISLDIPRMTWLPVDVFSGGMWVAEGGVCVY